MTHHHRIAARALLPRLYETRVSKEWVRWPRTGADHAGTGQPHRPPRRACAVLGDVAGSGNGNLAYKGIIDLYIENTTEYPNVRRRNRRRNPGVRLAPLAPPRGSAPCALFFLPVNGCTWHSRADLLARLLAQEHEGYWHANNRIKESAGISTFVEINLDGPNSGIASLGLKFKFVRRDTGQPISLPWLQFTLFDFDMQGAGGSDQGGREVRDTTPPLPLPPRPFCRSPPTEPHPPPPPPWCSA